MNPIHGEPARRRWWPRPAAGLLVAIAVVAAAGSAPSTVASAVPALSRVSVAWLAAAIVAQLVAVLGRAQLQRVLVGATGAVRPRLADYLAVTYVGAAVSSTLPGGPALAAAYTYRQLRTRGVTDGRAMWTVAVSGLVTTAVIASVSTILFTLAGQSTATTLITGGIELAAAGALAILARWAARHPDRLAAALTALWRRPAGRRRIVAIVRSLTGIRPRREHWTAAVAWAGIGWAADVACLTLCLVALGVPVPSLAAVVAAYAAGVAATQAALTPAGFGVTEAAITAVLAAHGSPAQLALAAVLLFRLLNPGLNTAAGALLSLARPRRNRWRRDTFPAELGRPRELAALAA